MALALDPGLFAAAALGAGLALALIMLAATLRASSSSSGSSGSSGVSRSGAGSSGVSDSRVGSGRIWWPGRSRGVWAWPRGSSSASDAAVIPGVHVARLAGAVTAAVVVLVVTRWVVAAVASAALVLTWRRLFGGARWERERLDRLEGLAIWTEALRDTVAAHAGLEHAIPVSAAHAPRPLRTPLARLVGQLRAHVPLETALRGLAADLDDPGADVVIAALILNVNRRGDRLADVLGGLSASAREELDLHRRVAAGRAGLRRAVQLIALITLTCGGGLVVFGRTYLAPYDTLAGQTALTIVIATFAGGFAWMSRLTNSPRRPGFLNRRDGDRLWDWERRIISGLTTAPPPTGGSRP